VPSAAPSEAGRAAPSRRPLLPSRCRKDGAGRTPQVSCRLESRTLKSGNLSSFQVAFAGSPSRVGGAGLGVFAGKAIHAQSESVNCQVEFKVWGLC
jgi:hypothetical protein